jgi:DNA-binding NarL/FixJ family response regulator
MSSPVKIAIADDHPIVRKGVREVLEETAGFAVVGEAGDGESALALVAAERPDVLILDVDMPKKDGFEVLQALEGDPARPEIVLMTMHGREEFLRRAFDRGVRAYVVKEGAMLDVVDAVRAVLAGRSFISSALSENLLVRRAGTNAPAAGPPEGMARLTPAERRVLRRIAEFKTSKEIAGELGIHYRTVENHRTSIAGKLGLSGSHALTKFAVENRERLDLD